MRVARQLCIDPKKSYRDRARSATLQTLSVSTIRQRCVLQPARTDDDSGRRTLRQTIILVIIIITRTRERENASAYLLVAFEQERTIFFQVRVPYFRWPGDAYRRIAFRIRFMDFCLRCAVASSKES